MALKQKGYGEVAFFTSYIAIAFMNNNLHTIFKSLNEVKVWSTAFASSQYAVKCEKGAI